MPLTRAKRFLRALPLKKKCFLVSLCALAASVERLAGLGRYGVRERLEFTKALSHHIEAALSSVRAVCLQQRPCTNLSDRRSAAPRGAETQRNAVDAAPIDPTPRHRDVKGQHELVPRRL